MDPSSRQAKVSAVILAPDVQHQDVNVCSALLQLGGRNVIEYWLQSLQRCKRCQPFSDQVHIVCSLTAVEQLQEWAAAAGLPASCIHTCDTLDSTSSSDEQPLLVGLQDLLQQRPQLGQQPLLLCDTSHVLEPGADLSRLVEATVVQGTDLLTSCHPMTGADLSCLMQVSLADPGAATCQVLSVSPASLAATSSGDQQGLRVLAPVMAAAAGSLSRHLEVALEISYASQVDRRATCHAAIATSAAEVESGYSPEASAAADEAVAAAHPSMWQLLGAAIGAAAAGGRPVYHLPLDFFFCVAEQEEYALVQAFFAEYLQAQGRLRTKVQGVAVGVEGRSAVELDGTISALTQKLTTLSKRPTIARHLGADSKPSVPTVAELFKAFYEKQQQKASCKAKPAAVRNYKQLPNRFQDPSRWQPMVRKQHACYNTTSAEYGSRLPGHIDMPLVWSGAVGGFASTFHGGCYVAMGLKTGVERSKVHKTLDGAW